MKSKDQQLLEEAYTKVSEARYRTGMLDRYGKFIPKPGWKSPSDDAWANDDFQLQDLKNKERNAGLENDVQIPSEPAKTVPSSTPSAATPEKIDFDLSSLANKKIVPVMWDYPDVVIEIDGKPVGPTFNKEEGNELVKQLHAGNHDSELVQRFLRGARQMGDLGKL